MKIRLLGTALALGVASTTAIAGADNFTAGYTSAEWQLYGWQNYTYEFTDVENNTSVTGDDQKSQKLRNNAAHIGFRASLPTGLSMGGQDIKANLQCEQFTWWGGEFGGVGPAWCNRNSKISLSGAFGEIMWGNWLTPYNEMLAGWIDPYWDADFTSHTALMGTINNFDYTGPGAGPSAGSGGAAANGFNKRQDSLVQYWSPNLNGLQFRLATTTHDLGDEEITDSNGSPTKLDPRLIEGGVTYTHTLANGNEIWVGTTFSIHDEWAALDFECSDSKDEGLRFAGRYTHQWGGGASTKIAAMWENIEYDWEDCGFTSATAADGVGSFVSTGIDGATDLELEKDTWLVSFTHAFGNGWDIRGTYMDADEFDCDTGCTTEDDTDAKSYNFGFGYTTPAGTMLAIKYAHVDNEDNSRYDTGFWAAGDGALSPGSDVDVWALSITQAF